MCFLDLFVTLSGTSDRNFPFYPFSITGSPVTIFSKPTQPNEMRYFSYLSSQLLFLFISSFEREDYGLDKKILPVCTAKLLLYVRYSFVAAETNRVLLNAVLHN